MIMQPNTVYIYEPLVADKWAQVSLKHKDKSDALNHAKSLSAQHPTCVFMTTEFVTTPSMGLFVDTFFVDGEEYKPSYPQIFNTPIGGDSVRNEAIGKHWMAIHVPIRIEAWYWYVSPDNSSPPVWHDSKVMQEVSTVPLSKWVMQNNGDIVRNTDHNKNPRIYRVRYTNMDYLTIEESYWSGGSRMTNLFAMKEIHEDVDKYNASLVAIMSQEQIVKHHIHHIAKHIGGTSIAPMQDLFARIGIEIGTIISQGNLTDEQKMLLADVNKYVEKIIDTLGQDS